MIKKFIYSVLLAGILFAATSCTEWLTIKPEGKVVLEDYWQSESSVDYVLASCYRGLTEDACINRMIVWGELRSDNMVSSGITLYELYKILNGDITSSNSFSNWGSFYAVINYCNTVLYYAPGVLERDYNFTQGDLRRVQAEAKTLRALCYFYLVRAFKEVPWVDVASVDDTQNYDVPKSSENAVLDSLISDLNSVRNWASPDFGSKIQNKGRITRNAVNTLLADIYLWKNDYDNCITACDRVLADTTIKLVPEEDVYTSVFSSGNSSESIFELQFVDNVQRNNIVRFWYGSSDLNEGFLSFPPTLAYNTEEKVAGLFSPFAYKVPSTTAVEGVDDVRAKDSYRLYSGLFFIYKYVGNGRIVSSSNASKYTFRTTSPNWIVYRKSDVILMKAEALAQKGSPANLVEAVQLANLTYKRSNSLDAPLEASNYPTKEDVQKLVLRERQREFLFEGKRWFDLVRLAKRDGTTSNMNGYVEAKSSGAGASLGAPVLNAMYMPVNKTELEANPYLTQNPFYEESGNSSTR